MDICFYLMPEMRGRGAMARTTANVSPSTPTGRYLSKWMKAPVSGLVCRVQWYNFILKQPNANPLFEHSYTTQ